MALVFGGLFVALLALRVWGVSSRFWLLEDQIRDWGIALRPLTDQPLLGPPTHVHGYTIGPAFYWILWVIRVTVGPWFDYLPHGGGIGEAILHSAADVLLCAAVWKRTGSVGAAVATSILLASAAYDLCFAALVWNPPMGTTLAKAATALVLLGWHRQSTLRVVVVFALAWAAVQAYTGAVFVTIAVVAAALVDPLVHRARDRALRNFVALVGVVVALQVPYLLYALRTRFDQPVMGAVTGSIADVITGGGKTQFAASAAKYVDAVAFVQGGPWPAPWMLWLLVAAGLVVVVRYWRDPALVLLLTLPALTAIAGYGLFQGALDFYYYLSLMPAAVLTVVFAFFAVPWPRVRVAAGIALLVVAVALVPSRVKYSATFHQLPQYRAIVAGSRIVAQRGTPMRAVRTEFALPPTCDPEFVYRVLGGAIDRTSPWIAMIAADGTVSYQAVAPS